jgi:hypothetical protein
MKTKAVIEKITEDNLILLVGKDEKEMIISKVEFPDSINYREGDWLEVNLIDGKVEFISLDEAETKKVKKRIQEKLDRLRKRDKSN